MPTLLTAADIRAHLDADTISWVSRSDAKSLECVDGRQDAGIIGSPGGGVGEFVLALAAAEKTLGSQIAIEEIPAMLDRYVEQTGPCYMHTDAHALEHASMTEEKVLKPDDPVIAVKTLVEPDNIGCGHLRLMCQHPTEYGARVELVQACMRAFYQKLWSGSEDVRFVVLQGGHEEGAVVIIASEDESIVPMIRPKINGIQMFVYHGGLIGAARQRLDIEKVVGTDVEKEAYEANVKTLGDQFLDATIEHLAKTLPVFTATFAADKTVASIIE